MSKSKGNFFTARDLFAKGVTPAALPLELVRTHYRSNANFTLQGLQDCQRMIDRWCRARNAAVAAAAADAQARGGSTDADESRAAGPFERALAACTAALCDDLNVARAIAALNEACAVPADALGNSCPQRELSSLLSIDSVLGVMGRNAPVAGAAAPDDPAFIERVESLIAARAAARARKDWKESDRVRDELAAIGVQVKDGPQGATWSRA